jgi:hypothetical protein
VYLSTGNEFENFGFGKGLIIPEECQFDISVKAFRDNGFE